MDKTWDLDLEFRARKGTGGYTQSNRWVDLDDAQFHAIETVLTQAQAQILALAEPVDGARREI